MAWDALLLFLVAIYSTYKTGTWSRKQNSLLYIGFFLASAFFLATELILVVDSILDGYNLTIYGSVIAEWGYVVVISFILSALAVLIRESKPVFAQFPLVYTGLPLLIILSYILVKDTLALKEWLVSIYQGGALLVALLMYSVYHYRYKGYSILLSSTALFILTYMVFWFIPVVRDQYAWIWQTMLGISIIVAVIGFEYAIDHHRELPTTGGTVNS